MKKLIILAVVAGVGLGLYLWLRPTEEGRVRKVVAALATTLSRPTGESTLMMALKTERMQELFGPEVSVQLLNFPGNGTLTANELASHATRLRPLFSSIELTFYDVDVQLEGADHATADLTARLKATREGNVREETRQLLCRLRKLEGKWRFCAFEEQAVLQR